MLEAFQASSHEDPPESGADSQETTPAPKAIRRANTGIPGVSKELVVVLFCVLSVGTFFLGRITAGSSVQAAGEGAPLLEGVVTTPVAADIDREVSVPVSAPAEEVSAAAQPVEEVTELSPLSSMEKNTRDFMDKENTVTLRVIYYVNNEEGREKAYETARHLGEMGFPAVTPIRKGDYVYVCVGSAPSKSDSDLLTYQRELQLVPGPAPYGKPGDYQSAYPYNIDKLIKRCARPSVRARTLPGPPGTPRTPPTQLIP